MKNLKPYQQFIYLGVGITALGLMFSVVKNPSISSLSLVFVVLGCLVLLIGMSKKRVEVTKEKARKG